MIIQLPLAILFAVLAPCIMGCVSMATGAGPWIESTLVLIGILLVRCLLLFGVPRRLFPASLLSICVAAGGIGGIAAVACGWTFPTLYFLQPTLFAQWLHTPWYSMAVLSAAVFISGSFGFLLANLWEHSFLHEQAMSFPIGELVYKTVEAQHNVRHALKLAWGALCASVLGLVTRFCAFIPSSIRLMSALQIGYVHIPPLICRLDTVSLYWAIGFVTGHVIAMPLLVGAVSKIVFVDVCHHMFFNNLKDEHFLLAFITGMVVYGALMSFRELPGLIMPLIRQGAYAYGHQSSWYRNIVHHELIQWGMLLISATLFFWYFNFSSIAALYVMVFTSICVYQLLIIAGKTGLAPFPRFATFVMMPGLVLFKFDAVQIMLVSLFVEVCAAVAVDVMFGRKLAHLSNIDHATIKRWQWLGLVISALVIGIVFWMLINRFGLGTYELSAQRARARASLACATQVNYIVMLLGALFAYLLRYIKVNPALVIGGLAMPLDVSLVLIGGGMSTYLVRNKEEHYPFWSGVFAAGSLVMLLRAL